MIELTIETSLGTVHATYSGREYIDIRYGDQLQAAEVINVFDYKRGEPVIENSLCGIEKALTTWLMEQDSELSIYSLSARKTQEDE